MRSKSWLIMTRNGKWGNIIKLPINMFKWHDGWVHEMGIKTTFQWIRLHVNNGMTVSDTKQTLKNHIFSVPFTWNIKWHDRWVHGVEQKCWKRRHCRLKKGCKGIYLLFFKILKLILQPHWLQVFSFVTLIGKKLLINK